MRRAPHRPPPVIVTRDQVEASDHYAKHASQIAHYPMTRVTVAEMEAHRPMREGEHPARGVPTAYCYDHGVIRVWPWPAEGWQVWSVLGHERTPP